MASVFGSSCQKFRDILKQLERNLKEIHVYLGVEGERLLEITGTEWVVRAVDSWIRKVSRDGWMDRKGFLDMCAL